MCSVLCQFFLREHTRHGGGDPFGIYVYVLLWDMEVGMYIDVYLWLTVGELRLLDVLVTLWGVRHDGSAPGGDMPSQLVWPWFSV